MQNIIKQYIRDKKTKQPRGITVAIKTDKGILYGYSLCNLKKDKWDKHLGTNIALARATSNGYKLPDFPETEQAVLEAFERLQSRCISYFKDLDLEDIVFTDHLELEQVNL